MKNLLYSLLALVIFLQACEEPNELVFVATQDEDGISFVNSLSSVYLLSESVADNTAERFIWEEADFGTPVNVTYELQASLNSEFLGEKILGTTPETHFAVSVSALLDLASELGLDDDPATVDSLGNPNNSGTIFVRVRAFVGAGDDLDTLSEVLSLDLEIVEKQDVGAGCDPLFGLGDALVDAGWNWGPHIVLSCEQDVFQAKVNLTNGTFRFFTIENDWASGLNYPYFAGEGYTVSELLEDAEDGDNNFRFVGDPGIYVLTIDDNAKTLSLEPSSSLWLVGAATPGGWDWGGATEVLETEVDVYEATLDFSNEAFRVFTVRDDWNSGLNFPFYTGEGYTIDSNLEDAVDGDNNFRFIGTPGNYTFTLNGRDKTIVLQ